MDTKSPSFLPSATMAAAIALCGFTAPVSASEAFEREQLSLLIKQIENATAIAQQTNTQITPSNDERFWFDYERLERDLKKIQHGVEHYLTPHRAQPREIHDEVASSYTRDRRELKTGVEDSEASNL